MGTILGNATVITVDEKRRIYTDGAVDFEGSIIKEAGKTDDIRSRYPGYHFYNMKDHILCQASNAKLASGFCPVPELLDAGVNVALGTDAATCDNAYDMFDAMRLAAIIHKGRLPDPLVIPAETAIEMATIGLSPTSIPRPRRCIRPRARMWTT